MPMPDFVKILNRRINWNSSGKYYGPTTADPMTTTNIPILFEGDETVNSTNVHGQGVTSSSSIYDE